MICEVCYGKCRLTHESKSPCPECGGSGVVYCCDGLRETPYFVQQPVYKISRLEALRKEHADNNHA